MDRSEIKMGEQIIQIAYELKSYCRAYQEHFGSPIGGDAILGDEGVRDILRGLNTLLNGPLGQQDGGTLSKMLYDIAAKNGLLDENGEF